jgi:hypothetical protein
MPHLDQTLDTQQRNAAQGGNANVELCALERNRTVVMRVKPKIQLDTLHFTQGQRRLFEFMCRSMPEDVAFAAVDNIRKNLLKRFAKTSLPRIPKPLGRPPLPRVICMRCKLPFPAAHKFNRLCATCKHE